MIMYPLSSLYPTYARTLTSTRIGRYTCVFACPELCAQKRTLTCKDEGAQAVHMNIDSRTY